MKNILILLCSLIYFGVVSQDKNSYKITGTITSKETKKPLESATIYITKVGDSIPFKYTISDKKGQFLLEGKTSINNVMFIVSFYGYKNYLKQYQFSAKNNLKLLIALEDKTQELDEIVLKYITPIIIRNDTLIINPKAFNTRKRANIEDLLKKIPGFEVDINGSIKIHGVAVSKIQLNGKDFFTNDITIATRNIEKDFIETIEVTDDIKKGDAKNDNRDKTKVINLKLKKEFSTSFFGKIMAGKALPKYYEYGVFANAIRGKSRISAVVSGNDINIKKFSMGNISNNSELRGLTKTRTIGVNYVDTYKKSLDINTEYNTKNIEYTGSISRDRKNSLPDLTYTTKSNSSSTNKNDNHQGKVGLNYKNKIQFNTEFSYNDTENYSTQNNESLDDTNKLVNTSKRTSKDKGSNKEIKSYVMWNNTPKKENGFSYSFEVGISSSSNSNISDRKNSYKKVQSASIEEQDRQIDFNKEKTTILSFVSVDKKISLNLGYGYKYDDINSKRQYYDNISLKEDNLLTTNYKLSQSSHYVYSYIGYNSKNFMASIEVDYKPMRYKIEDNIRKDLNLNRLFKPIDISSYARYTLSKKKSIGLYYSKKYEDMKVHQIYGFIDRSNPFYIRQGNINLKLPYRYSYVIRHNNRGGKGFYINISFTDYKDFIVQKTIIDKDLTKTVSFENIENGSFFFSPWLSYDNSIKPSDALKIKINVRLNPFDFRKGINYQNNNKYSYERLGRSASLNLNFNQNNNVSINAKYKFSTFTTTFSISNLKKFNFSRHSLNINSRVNISSNLEWINNINYEFINDNNKYLIWGSQLSYFVMKTKGIIKIKAFDILGENKSFIQNLDENYIENISQTVLDRYFMLSFTYNFKSTKSK